jgi:hypothetical protein
MELAKTVYVQQWQIQSHSTPNKFYKVSLTENGEYQCSCPVWIFRRKQCKHIEQVKAAA